jgi:hypothetical protein
MTNTIFRNGIEGLKNNIVQGTEVIIEYNIKTNNKKKSDL